MCAQRASLLTRLLVVCFLMGGPGFCMASQKNTSCYVWERRADCSHLNLSAVPPDLPGNIISLDMSHNRLVRILPETLNPYPGLIHLNVSHNSINKLDGGVCQTLPHLQTLNLEHNHVSFLKKEDLSHCTSLTWLNMANNTIRIEGEPFSALESLKFLDVSLNRLQSPVLGSQPQLPRLEELRLGSNYIIALSHVDFIFLNQSSFLRVLNLSSLRITMIETGSFKPISGLRSLILDRSIMGTLVISELCSALSGTNISSLSLLSTRLVTLTNTTFKGLKETNLTFLNLAGNGMRTIADGSFQWVPRLETLILSDNYISQLTNGTFQGLKSLKMLQLSRVFMKIYRGAIIDDFSFQPLKSLESLILHQIAVRELTEHTFTGLTSLTVLDMSWSSSKSLKIITNNTFASLADSPLRMLNLTGTGITRINPGSFSVFRNLTTLMLDFNFIKQSITGKEFEGLEQIQEIHMSNNIQSIDLRSESFANVAGLRVLTLGKSLKATTLNLEPSPFRPLSNLTYLDLSNNNIANIRESLLEGLGNLKVLKLQHNNLARVWKSANPGGPVLFLKDTKNLITLHMDYNALDEIPVEALRGPNHLRELSLTNNLLNNLKDSVFDDLTSLQILRFEKNLITAVRPEVFKTPMSNLSLLTMGKNPFDCTCESILWFATWLNTTNMTHVPGLRDLYSCKTPLSYFNHSILDFDPLSCKDMTPFQALYILSSTAVTALVVTALLVRFQGWRIQFYWNILINRTLGFSDTTAEEGREFEYDAYVVHAEKDASWVERRMVPLENEKCRFYLEDRDAVLGMSQLESIVDNMRKSRKILFVITESLLRDPWCRRFKVHHALHQVIEASRDSVVLVFLQDVHDYKLSRALFLHRGMLRSRCVLDWPVHKERVPAFHQKLLIALGLTNR